MTVLSLYVRARNLPALAAAMLVVDIVLFTPVGSLLVPRTDLSMFDLETPLRLYATALLGAFPCAALGAGALPVERSARISWPALHLGGGVALIALGAVTLAVGCAAVTVARPPIMLAYVLLTGLSLLASAVVGPAGWTLGAGYSTLCAFGGAPDTWWAVLLRDPTPGTWLLSTGLVLAGLAAHLALTPRSPDDD